MESYFQNCREIQGQTRPGQEGSKTTKYKSFPRGRFFGGEDKFGDMSLRAR